MSLDQSMSVKVFNQFRRSNGPASFNLTPVIDIVFLLIIFFCVVSHFIEAENFPVAVPDGCNRAQSDTGPAGELTTVTIMKTDGGKAEFAVGAEKVSAADYGEIAARLAELIDSRLKAKPANDRVITLRVDKDVCYADAQYALAAIAESTATDIRLAALKDIHSAAE